MAKKLRATIRQDRLGNAHYFSTEHLLTKKIVLSSSKLDNFLGLYTDHAHKILHGEKQTHDQDDCPPNLPRVTLTNS
jgi:hypothetical protein